MGIHHVKGFQDPSTYSKYNGGITFATNFWTPCRIPTSEVGDDPYFHGLISTTVYALPSTWSGFEEAMMEGPVGPMGAAGGGDPFMDLMSPDGAGGINQFLDDNM